MFSSVIGHRRLLTLLSRAIARDTLPPALLLAGPAGVGKRRVALAIARFVGAADTPSLDGEPTTPAVAAAIDGALTTPVFLLVVVGAFAPGRWRRRRAVGPRLLFLGVAATFVALVARLQAGWGYGGARHVLPGAILLLPFAGEGFVTVGGFISRVVARRRLAVVLASFTAIPLAVKAVMRPEGESQIDARRLGERLAEIAKAEGSTRLVVATFREPLVAYYADRARRADGGAARDVPLWGAYRLLLSDLVILTGCEEPLATDLRVERLRAAIAEVKPDLPVIESVFRPQPVEPERVRGRRVAFFSTAPDGIHARLREHLARDHGAEVVLVSGNLGRRQELRADLASVEARSAEVYLVELKAAAIDVVAETAAERGVELVLCDNEVRPLRGDHDLDELLSRIADRVAPQVPA